MSDSYLDIQLKLQSILGKANMDRIKLPPQAMPRASEARLEKEKGKEELRSEYLGPQTKVFKTTNEYLTEKEETDEPVALTQALILSAGGTTEAKDITELYLGERNINEIT